MIKQQQIKRIITCRLCQALVDPREDNKFKWFIHSNKYSREIPVPGIDASYDEHKQYEDDCAKIRQEGRKYCLSSLKAKITKYTKLKPYKHLKPMGHIFNTGYVRNEEVEHGK